MMDGLASVNVELSSKCQKKCAMCGRRKLEKLGPVEWGDMPLGYVTLVASQIPSGVTVQLHNNGEPLMYPDLKAAFKLFAHTRTGLNTNGKLLMDKADEIIGQIDTLTISVIQDDPEGREQLEIANDFLEMKGKQRPLVTLRLLGEIDVRRYNDCLEFEEIYGCLIAKRVLHAPEGSRGYEKPVTIPEMGVCLEILHKLSIDRHGNISVCVRLDPERKGVIGNIEKDTLLGAWLSRKRHQWISHHLNGRRDMVPICAECDYFGIPRS